MAAEAPSPEIVWTESGPRSTRFDDVYFSAEDGLAESRAVFLQGCDLPEGWRRRRRFVVGELGFGTGLNIAALLALWREARPAGGTLHIFSVEQFPLTREAAVQALARWPELSGVTPRLLNRWPAGPGFHRIGWPEMGATLDIFHGEAMAGLSQWDGRADAWFLDGFAPARNPEMWRPELVAAVAQRSAPGARAATFTVAGEVRRNLQNAGFTVEKRPGFGRKRERLEARRPGAAEGEVRLPTVAAVGAGIAGLSVVRALRALGLTVTIVANPDERGASGNPAALVSPRFDTGDDAAARLHRQAFARAIDLYTDAPEVVIARGLLQLAGRERDGDRFARLDGIPAGRTPLRPATATEAEGKLGEPVFLSGLIVEDALTVEPAAITAAWSVGARRVEGHVAALEPTDDGWRLLDGDNRCLAMVDTVVLCAGAATPALRSELTLRPVRGQATVSDDARLGAAVAWGGYAIPTRTGVLFGATHDRDDRGTEVRAGDDTRNLDALRKVRPRLAEKVEGSMRGVAGLRAATPDHLPIAGELQPGLFVLTGLGGRGFTTAPLLGEHLAARIAGAPSPLPADLAHAVRPR